ncbi:major latex protein 15-like [Papaver somniferum]|uniref:major latex protein 15-like n=1 Tax=Papaver somniferum TaxID=3469 RepID=UPI000E6FEE55|nr:major latex protein 15-like [Papaver somniferum]
MAQHHTISGLVGKLVTESEVNCSADKYYGIFKQHVDIRKAIPHIFTAVKVTEGHGTTSACVKQWDYIVEGKNELVHTIEYEKINKDSPVPVDYLGFFQSAIEDLNSYICASQ